MQKYNIQVTVARGIVPIKDKGSQKISGGAEGYHPKTATAPTKIVYHAFPPALAVTKQS